MANFEIAYGITRKIEGGWHGGSGVNSADRGGETFKGIARKSWPNWEGWKLIDGYKKNPIFVLKEGMKTMNFPENALGDPTLTKMVHIFYKVNFWDVSRLGEIRSQGLANELFDTAVNVGSRQGSLWLQLAVNLLNRGQKSWKDIQVDGKIGAGTLGAVNSLNEVDSKSLFNLLNIYQGSHYVNLATKDQSQEDFVRGWLVRVEVVK